MVTSRSSVISSIAYRGPSRPNPLSFTPPYGIRSTRLLDVSLMCTAPTRSRRLACIARSMSCVNTPAASPYAVASTCASAASNVSNGTTEMTGAKISCDFHGSEILPGGKPKSFNEPDVHSLITKLHANGGLAGFDLANSIFNFLLPSGSVLKLDADSSLGGLGGYHGSVHVKKGGVNSTLYYSVGVFSEFLPNGNENGIVAFDKPWKNVVGTFYHELNEYRTDADVDDAIKTNNNDFLGWMSRQGEEIGDNPISASQGVLKKVFAEVKLTGKKTTVPVQFMYSNFVHGAEGPIAKPHA